MFENGALQAATILLHLHGYEVFLLPHDHVDAVVAPLNSK